MSKEYRHLSFASDEDFVAHHQQQALAGNERSRSIIETRNRLDLTKHYQMFGGPQKKDTSDLICDLLDDLRIAGK